MTTAALDVAIERPAPAALFELRADAEGAVALGRLLGVQLLTQGAQAASIGALDLLRLGPDRWWLTAPAAEEAKLAASLAAVERGHHVMVTLLSDAVVRLRVRGRGCHALLAQGIALDLDAEVFAPGMAARCGLARVSVVLHRTGRDAFELYVEAPLEQYLHEWLATARDVMA